MLARFGVIRGCVGMRTRLVPILRAQATNSQVSLRSVATLHRSSICKEPRFSQSSQKSKWGLS